MRDIFREWGVGLDDAEFAKAVAARLLSFAIETRDRTGESARLEAEVPSPGPRSSRAHVRGTWAGLRARWASRPAADVGPSWASLGPQDEIRIAVPALENIADDDAKFCIAVLDACLQARPRVAISATSAVRAGREWNWPLRVGIPRAFAAAEIAATSWHQFLSISALDASSPDLDVLYIPASVSEALAYVSSGNVSARFIFVAGPVGAISSTRLPGAIAALKSLCGARAAALLQPGAERSSLHILMRLGDEIAHDLPLDVALLRAAGTLEATSVIVSADDGFLAQSRASRRLVRLNEKLRRARPHLRDLAPHRLRGFERMARAVPPLELRPELADWGREVEAATALATLAGEAATRLERAGLDAPARFLQTRVWPASGPQVVQALVRREQSYAAEVWIGNREPNALALERGFPRLRNPEDTHDLEVVFNEPRLLSAPQVATIRLPPIGKSSTCKFFFTIGPDVDQLDARIIILHRGRVLQTGALRASMRDNGLLEFLEEASPRRRLQTLGSRTVFDAAIVANHDATGAPQRVAIAGDRVARIKLADDGLAALSAIFAGTLSQIVADPDAYAFLDSDASVALLRKLAQHGASLHEAVVRHNQVGPQLAKARRLQIVTTRVDAFIPLELAYQYEAPDDDAKLCPNADAGLRSGTCPSACSDGGSATRVCPLGFWCTSKTIERYAHRSEFIDENADYTLYAAEAIGRRPTLPQVTSCLLGTSDRVEKGVSGALAPVLASIAAAANHEHVISWNAWNAAIDAHRPQLLVLLPHHVQQEGVSQLEVGKDSRLKATLLKSRHVMGAPDPSPLYHPIVLLVGCETQDAPVSLERFPARFLDRGAALVVATVATVLGRHAAPTAARLVDLILTAPAGESVGDVMLRARRDLLREGYIMSLALAVLGDADWRFA